MPTAGDHMKPLKDVIDQRLLVTLVKHQLSDMEMELMRLPAHLGAMSLDDPMADSRQKYADSVKCTVNLTQQFVESGDDLVGSIECDYKDKVAVRQDLQASLRLKADELQKHLPEAQQHAMPQAREEDQAHSPPLLLLNMFFSLIVRLTFMITSISTTVGHWIMYPPAA